MRIKKVLKKIFKRMGKGNLVAASRKKGVTIGEGCRFVDMPIWGSEPWLVTLGNQILISKNVTFVTHDGATWVFRDKEKYKNVIRYGKIVVGDNSFIGINVTILPNVTIGENSVIGACSLVCKDVEPNSVYAGVPARRICSIEEYAEKCLRETPEYDKVRYKENKREEVLRSLAKMEK